MSSVQLVRLEESSERKSFDCGDSDLNEFFFEDSKGHSAQLLAVTYAYEVDGETVAFFSVLNDSIRKQELTRVDYKKLTEGIPHKKNYSSHPAVKIGRFAVAEKFQGQGHGKDLINFIKAFFIIKNKTGCRFITLDAYEGAVGFYNKNGFKYLTIDDEGKTRRQMYLDLKPLASVIPRSIKE